MQETSMKSCILCPALIPSSTGHPIQWIPTRHPSDFGPCPKKVMNKDNKLPYHLSYKSFKFIHNLR